jgi:hypothetical protein
MSAAICGTFPGVAEFIIGPAHLGRTRWLTRAIQSGHPSDGSVRPLWAIGGSHYGRAFVLVQRTIAKA